MDNQPQTTPENALSELRVMIDRCIKYAQALRNSEGMKPSGRELSLVVTKLEEGKMWAGKAKGAMGVELPEQYRDEAKQ